MFDYSIVYYGSVRQCPLKLCNAGRGYRCVGKINVPQAGQSVQVFQPRIGNGRVSQSQPPKPGQILKVLEPCTGYLSSLQIQRTQSGEMLDVCKPFVGNRTPGEIERAEFVEVRQVGQVRIGWPLHAL